jgi:hypothetical protein
MKFEDILNFMKTTFNAKNKRLCKLKLEPTINQCYTIDCLDKEFCALTYLIKTQQYMA